jgi:4-hydroxy-tetrahydrodipicolinate synthase
MPNSMPDFNKHFYTTLTPFKPDTFEIDEDAFVAMLDRVLTDSLIERGVALIVNAEAGESPCLERGEFRRLVEIAMDKTKGRVPVVAGTIALRTEHMVEIAKDAKNLGVDGIFVAPPLGSSDITLNWDNTRYLDVFTDLIRAVDSAVDLPMIVHPTVSPKPQFGVGLPTEPSLRLCAAVPNITGWKMTYSWEGWKDVGTALQQLDKPVAVLGAGAHKFHEALAYDLLDGSATASHAYALEQSLDHIETFRESGHAKALKLWNGGLYGLHKYLYVEPSRLHVRYKAAAWVRGVIPNPILRRPMPQASPAEANTLRSLMQSANVPVIPQDEFDEGVRRYCV